RRELFQGSGPPLAEEHRTRGIPVDRSGDHRHERGRNSEADGCSQDVDRPLGDSNASQHGRPYHAAGMVHEMVAPIRLTVPGTLLYRAIAVRVVAEAARLVSKSDRRDPNDLLSNDVRDPFDTAVVSAFMEIFNNVAIHAYQRRGGGVIGLAITPVDRELLIELKDHGKTFDIDGVEPLPEDMSDASLPEGGMGIHIAKTMLDEV